MAKYLTVSECAELTGFKGRRITEWIKKGYIKGVRGPGSNKKMTRFYVMPDALLATAKKMNLPVETINRIKGVQ